MMQDQVTEKADLDEALKLARADIRDLQRTVSALRDALEAAHAEAQAGVARANAATAGLDGGTGAKASPTPATPAKSCS